MSSCRGILINSTCCHVDDSIIQPIITSEIVFLWALAMTRKAIRFGHSSSHINCSKTSLLLKCCTTSCLYFKADMINTVLGLSHSVLTHV